jgi:hypothetical protein
MSSDPRAKPLATPPWNDAFGQGILGNETLRRAQEMDTRHLRDLLEQQKNYQIGRVESQYYPPPPEPQPGVCAHLIVEKTTNGFILTMGKARYVAKDADELRDIFITALVAAKLEGK